jgi:MYXO-CTERM domain-containing protein
MSRRAALIGLFAFSARAGILFEDDFESGHLLAADGGAWTSQDLVVADGSVSVAASQAAAHRGSLGVRFVDGDSSTGAGTVVDLDAVFNAGSSQVFFRTWMRLDASDDAGEFGFFTSSSQAGGLQLMLLNCQYTAQGCDFRGHDVAGQLVEQVPYTPGDGQWHLLEVALLGLGTPSGQRAFWVDGVLQADAGALDYQGVTVSDLAIGEPTSGDWSFTGAWDYDDVRVSTEPPASRLVLTAPPTLAAGACASVTVSLVDSLLRQAAPAPYSFAVLLGTNAGAFATDATCGTPQTAATFPADAGTVEVWFSALSPGAAALTAQYVDFLPGGANVLVTDGGGAPPDGGPTAVLLPAIQTVDPGTRVTLDGSGSRATAPAVLTGYSWGYPSGPTGLSLDAGPTQSLVLSVPGDYRFQLTVQDSAGRLSAPASAAVHVNGAFPPPPGPGCGCASGETSGAAVWLLFVAAVGGRFRRGTVGAGCSSRRSPG